MRYAGYRSAIHPHLAEGRNGLRSLRRWRLEFLGLLSAVLRIATTVAAAISALVLL
jgi:hypothetical protein